jgi:hypothetical protein
MAVQLQQWTHQYDSNANFTSKSLALLGHPLMRDGSVLTKVKLSRLLI